MALDFLHRHLLVPSTDPEATVTVTVVEMQPGAEWLLLQSPS